MDLPSAIPTSEPSSNSRGQSSGEAALTNAEVLIVSMAILITFLFTVQSFARWYTKDSDYSLLDIGIAALAALSQFSPRLKQNINRSGPQGLVPHRPQVDDVEAGWQVRFVEVEGSHWHSHSNAPVGGQAPLPANHDPNELSQALSRSPDLSAMDEQMSAVPVAVSRRVGWERVFEEERLGMVSARWTDSPTSPQPQEQQHEEVDGNAIQELGGVGSEGRTSDPLKEAMFVESRNCDMEDAALSAFVMSVKEWFDDNEGDIIDYSSYVSDITTQKALDDFFASNYDMPFNDSSD